MVTWEMMTLETNRSLLTKVKNLRENIKHWSKAHLLIVGRCHLKYDVKKYISFPALHRDKPNLSVRWPNEVPECKTGRTRNGAASV